MVITKIAHTGDQSTLPVYFFRGQKNYPLPIQHPRPSGDSQELKARKSFLFLRVNFQKIPFLYFFLHKAWIWQTLGQVVNIFSCCHFHNTSKECFWPKEFLNFIHRFKSTILAIFQFCQNGTFEPVHEIQKIFWPKSFL